MADTENQSPSTDLIAHITVPDRDLSPSEVARIMRQVSRVCNFVVAGILRNAATTKHDHVAGPEHPVIQTIIGCASQAGAAAVNLENINRPQVLPAGGPVPVPPRNRA